MTITCICCDLTADKVTALSTFVIAVATALLGIAAFLQYRKNSDIKQAEFLISLYEKFYENTELKTMREWVDNKPFRTQSEFELMNKSDNFEEKFTDYLNFFQFIVVLKNLKQIKEDEIKQMFHYYLKLLKNTDFIMEYLSANGYKELKTFLSDYKDDK